MTRFVLALLAAFGITASLFFLMQMLIASADTTLSEAPKGRVLDFVRVKQDESIKQKENKPKRPPKPKEPPPPMEAPQLDSPNPDAAGAISNFAADVANDVGLDGGLSLDSGDGEYLPIVKVAAVYPRRALSRGIEGYVIVEFTVSKQGTVSEPFVVEANPQGIFEKAALEAVLKFKYKARVVNGEPMAVSGVQNRITFEMDG